MRCHSVLINTFALENNGSFHCVKLLIVSIVLFKYINGWDVVFALQWISINIQGILFGVHIHHGPHAGILLPACGFIVPMDSLSF